MDIIKLHSKSFFTKLHYLKTLQLVQMEVMWVLVVTQKHSLSCGAAEASDTQLSQVSGEAGQVLSQGGGGGPW